MELNEIKLAIEQQGIAIEELRTSVDEGKTLSQGHLDKIKADFLAGEEANKAIQAKIDKQESEIETQKNLITDMEKKLYRFPAGTSDIEKKEEIDAFERHIIEMPKQMKNYAMDEMERKYLRTDIAIDGGVLVPETLSNELIKQEIEVSPIMANARVINAKIKSLTVGVRTTIPSVNRPGEGGTSTKSNSKYESKRIEAYRNDVVVAITREELNFAAFNMREQMTSDAALALTEQTNIDFLNGDGVSKSEGIMVDAAVGEINSGIANDISMDNFLALQKKDNIKGVYRRNGKFYMNANTLFDLLAKKDGTGQYLWNQNIALGLPNTLAGRPYIDTPDMPDVSTGTYPVFFGDLKRAYYILRALGIEVVIDPYTPKLTGMIDYLWIEFLGGKVVLPEAIVKLKVSV